MPSQKKRIIVLMLTNRDHFGFDEHALSALVALMASASPGHSRCYYGGVIGYFVTSRTSFAAVHDVIQGAEILREADIRFARLGIGLGEGEMIREFTILGRLRKNPEMFPLGDAATTAYRSANGLPHAYLSAFDALRNEFTSKA